MIGHIIGQAIGFMVVLGIPIAAVIGLTVMMCDTRPVKNDHNG